MGVLNRQFPRNPIADAELDRVDTLMRTEMVFDGPPEDLPAMSTVDEAARVLHIGRSSAVTTVPPLFRPIEGCNRRRGARPTIISIDITNRGDLLDVLSDSCEVMDEQ